MDIDGMNQAIQRLTREVDELRARAQAAEARLDSMEARLRPLLPPTLETLAEGVRAERQHLLS